MANLTAKRFEELEAQRATVEATKSYYSDAFTGARKEQIDDNQLLTWKVKVKSLLATVCGEQSQHFKHFEDSEHSPYSTNLDNFRRMGAVFSAAKEDFEGGYLSSLRTHVQAEVFDSELDQASELLRSGHKTPAAVVAGIVLETTLRELCDRNGLPHGKLDRMNAELAKKGVYTLLVQKRITTLAQIRNDAAHGNPDQFSDADVKSMIGDIQRFVTDYLS
jgi:hypothetical protein